MSDHPSRQALVFASNFCRKSSVRRHCCTTAPTVGLSSVRFRRRPTERCTVFILATTKDECLAQCSGAVEMSNDELGCMQQSDHDREQADIAEKGDVFVVQEDTENARARGSKNT